MDALLPGIISLSLIYKETHCRYLPSCGHVANRCVSQFAKNAFLKEAKLDHMD
jgi:hypothetical protein